MDFITGSLPNVMFLVGIIAIGVGLGLEFKIIEMKGTLNRTSRLGALGIGSTLIAVSILLYMRPAPTVVSDSSTAVVQANLSAPVLADDAPAPTGASPATAPASAATGVTAVPEQPIGSTTDEPLGAFRALLAASDVAGKQHAELLKHLAEVEEKLAEGKPKEAGDKLRELDKKLREAMREGELAEALGAQLRVLAGQIATTYGLDLDADKDD